MSFPHGRDEIVRAYGDPAPFIRDDGSISPLWAQRMVKVAFPAPLPLSWDLKLNATAALVNQVVAGDVDRVFQALRKEGLWTKLRTWGGGYAWRPQRGSSTKLSLHSWGAAMDFDTATNELGTIGDIDPGVVELFRSFGWTWGGTWTRRDDQHVQAASGY